MISNTVGNLCAELNLDKPLKGILLNAEIAFDKIAEAEGTKITMAEWIRSNVNSMEECKEVTEREKFFYVFGILSTMIIENCETDSQNQTLVRKNIKKEN